MLRSNKNKRYFVIIVVIFGFLGLVGIARADWPQQAKLTASDAADWDYFGVSVSIDGDYAIIGARYADADGPYDNRGAAYIFKRTGATWSQQAKLLASDGAANDMFGYSVSISGDYAIVSAVGDDAHTGSAYIFKRVGENWTQQAKLVASDGVAGDELGISVSISGDYAIAGAYFDDDIWGNDCGSAYIFEKPGGGWADANETFKLFAFDPAPSAGDRFGCSVSISGDYAIVGADFRDLSPSLIDAGSAYVFKREGIYWNPLHPKLTASDASAGDWFGSSVSINGDYAIVGATGKDTGPTAAQVGSAYIFKRNGAAWVEQANLMASDAANADYFGMSVSIRPNYALVGAWPAFRAGAGYMFRYDGTNWSELTKLTVPEIVTSDGFGMSVSISGDYAIVGAYRDDDKGSAFIFEQICPTADLSGDCCVNFQDYAVFAGNWQRDDCSGPEWCDGADLDQLGQVNWFDLAIFVNQWLQYN